MSLSMSKWPSRISVIAVMLRLLPKAASQALRHTQGRHPTLSGCLLHVGRPVRLNVEASLLKDRGVRIGVVDGDVILHLLHQ